MVSDPYAVLGVSSTATKDEIKKAYRQKAKQYHPDLHPNDPKAAEKMNEINQAYDMINNPEKYRQARNSYQGSYGQAGQGGYGYRGAQGSGTGYGTGSSRGTDDETGYSYNTYGDDDPWVMFDDLFGEIFRNSGRGYYQNTWNYDNRQNGQSQDTGEGYRGSASGRGGCLWSILRVILVYLAISTLLKACTVMSSPYDTGDYNSSYYGNYYQSEQQQFDPYRNYPGRYPEGYGNTDGDT